VGTGIAITTTGYTLGGAQAGNYVLTQPSLTADITAKALTLSGVVAENKVYDGNTAAKLSLTGVVLNGVVQGDSVSLETAVATGVFDTAAVGKDKPVTVSGLSLSGGAIGNYSLTPPSSLTASITPKPLTVTGVVAANKVYDGNIAATLVFSGASLVGVVQGDSVTLVSKDSEGSFSSASVGAGKAVTVSGLTLSGVSALNYSVTAPTGLKADITAKGVTVVGLSGVNKVYDRTTAATVSGTAALSGVIPGDTVTLGGTPVFSFASASVGTDITITATGYALSGDQAGNYSLTQPAGLKANITAKPISLKILAVSRAYREANPAFGFEDFGSQLAAGDTIADLVGGQGTAVDLSYRLATTTIDSPVGLYPGEIQVVTTSLDGAKVQNYAITLVAGDLRIVPAALTVTLDVGSLVQSYTGLGRSVSWFTQPAGVAVKATYNGLTVLPIVAGSYSVVVQSDDANYVGQASGVLVIRSTMESLRSEVFLVGSGLMPVSDTDGRYRLQASAGQSFAGPMPVVSGVWVQSGFWFADEFAEALNSGGSLVPSVEVAAKGIALLETSAQPTEAKSTLRTQDPQAASSLRLPEARLVVIPVSASMRVRIEVSGIPGARWKVQSLDGLHAEGWRDAGLLELGMDGAGVIETDVSGESAMRFYRLVQP
jgi:hypothetical protein